MEKSKMGNGFKVLMNETEETGTAYMEMVMKVSQGSALDRKTQELAYLSVLAALRMTGGIAYHVDSAKELGATKAEVMSAVLVGLPAVGIQVIDALEMASASYGEVPDHK